MAKYRLLSLPVGIFVILFPFLCEHGDVFSNGHDISLTTLAFMTILVAVAGIRGRRVKISTTDILCAIYLIYGALNILIVRGCDIDGFILARWGALTMAYILFRSLDDKKTVLWSLIVSAVIQSFYAIGQKAAVFSSNHTAFDVTGSFPNPGPLACWLAVGFIAATCLAVDSCRSGNRSWTVSAVSTLPIAVALYFADSRAGYLSVTVAMMIWGAYFIDRKYRKLCAAGVFTVALLMALLLYGYRPASADARLLIWKVSAGMIARSPVVGHGIASFGEKYMLFQADYLEMDTASTLALVADNTPYAYNEFIHIAAEQGVVGLLLLIAIIVSVLWRRGADNRQRIFVALLSALLMFSMFSYPADVFSLMFLFPLLLGSSRGKVVAERIFPRSVITALCIGSLLIAAAVVPVCFSTLRRHSEVIGKVVEKECGRDVRDYIRGNFDALKYNGVFANHYPQWVNACHVDTRMFPMETRAPSCETYCDIGDYFRSCGALREAEAYYKTASYMIPTRLTPKYKLWKLYVESARVAEAMETARRIMDDPLKVETVFTMRAKAEVGDFLEKCGDM